MDDLLKKRVCTGIRKFRTSWLEESRFRNWLARSENEEEALCTICSVTLKCTKGVLIKHAESNRHLENACMKGRVENNTPVVNNASHADNVKRAEIKLAAFFVEHNISLSIVDHLVPVIKDVCADPEIVRDIALGRTKSRQIVTNTIARREPLSIVDHLKVVKFSVFIDECTDMNNKKLLCILAQYVSPITHKVTTQLLSSISLDAANNSAESLYISFKKCFTDSNIPLNNLVGMVSDNAAITIENKDSFLARVKVDAPRIVNFNYICHSAQLIANRATEVLPRFCQNLLLNVSSYVSDSAKRSSILREFQEFFEIEQNQILKLSETKLLVLHQCVVRLLDDWEALKHFFILAVAEDNLESAETILNELTNRKTKAYFLFLKYVLNFFNSFDALFQSHKILIHKLFITSRQIIANLAHNFMSSDALENIALLDPESDEQLKRVREVYLGPECEAFLLNEPQECILEIKENCLNFYKASVTEMIKRLPYNDPFFEQLNFLDPSIAFSIRARNTFRDLSVVATRISHVDLTELAIEWRMLPRHFTEDKKRDLASLEIDEMWHEILNSVDHTGNKCFLILAEVVNSVLCLPYSNAEAKRILLNISDVKCKEKP